MGLIGRVDLLRPVLGFYLLLPFHGVVEKDKYFYIGNAAGAFAHFTGCTPVLECASH